MAKMQGTKTEDEDQGDDGGENKPNFVTSEQLNAAIASKLGEFSKKLPKLMEPQLAQFSATILEGLKGTQTPAGEGKAPDGELEKLRRENQATKDALAKMQADQERTVKQAKQDKARGLLEASLTAAKVHPKLLPGALRLLEDNVGESEDGKIVYRRTNAYGVIEEVSVDEAVRGWAKSEDGKAFISAPRASGSGGPPRVQAPPATPRAVVAKDGTVDQNALQSAKRELAEAMLGVAPRDAD